MTADHDGASIAPVIVLAGLRSGSTLLRFIMDSHSAMTCAADTEILMQCHEAAFQWRRLRSDPGRLSPRAVSTIRGGVDAMFADWLAATGKRRWCDCSLDSAAGAEEFLRIYPGAQFVCLYRDCCDVIASALEAYPWGLDADVLASFVRRWPGNSVAAMAAYWEWSTATIHRFESAHPDRCHRIQYEELVADPEQVAASLFTALGEAVEPGITERCFTEDHGPSGRRDHMIWATSRVQRSSVGRGARVPVGRIPEELRDPISELLEKLGYPGLDAPRQASAVVSGSADDPLGDAADAAKAAIEELIEPQLERRLDTMATLEPEYKRILANRPIKLTVAGADPARAAHWLIGFEPSFVSRRPIEPTGDVAWSITADAISLRRVMAGELNLAAAVRQRAIRLGDFAVGPSAPAEATSPTTLSPAQIRMRIMVRLLGPSVGRNERSPW